MLTLSYGSLRIGVRSDDPAPLRWLREFLTPAFDAADIPADAASVAETAAGRLAVLDIDPARYGAVLERARARAGEAGGAAVTAAAAGTAEDAAAAAGEVDCFTLDGEFQRGRSWLDPDHGCVIRDGKDWAFYLTRDGSGAVTVLASADEPKARLALMRVVRELATAHALRRGCLHVHGAAVELSGRAVVFAGPRRSGKSTLLLHVLLSGSGGSGGSGGVRYLTNDRLLVDVERDPPEARAMPTVVTLRQETLATFPGFRARLRSAGYRLGRTLAELAARDAAGASRPLPPGEGRGEGAAGPSCPHVTAPPPPASLSPAQHCALAGVEATGATRLASIVFPSLAPDVARFEVRPLPPGEAARRLGASLLLAGLPERSAAAFDGPEPPFVREASALEALCGALAERVPCLDVRLGPDAYEGSAAEGGSGGPPFDKLRANGVWDAIRERLS